MNAKVPYAMMSLDAMSELPEGRFEVVGEDEIVHVD